MDNTQLLIFKAITGFISDLDQEFGKRHKSIALYNRLLEKTGIIHVAPINKHIDCFRSFFNTNQKGMEEKNAEGFVNPKIAYSDRVYVDVGTVLRQSNKENSQIIWKHLLTIWGLIDSTSSARRILQESFGQSPNTEEDFLANIIDRVEKTVGDGSIPTDNPMSAISSLMQSGVMTDLVSGMQKGLSDGSLDVGKLMNSVQGMIGKMGGGSSSGGSSGGGGMPDLSQMMSTIGPMMAGMMGGGNGGGMPDLGQMMANIGPMMAGMNMNGNSSNRSNSSNSSKLTLEEEDKKE